MRGIDLAQDENVSTKDARPEMRKFDLFRSTRNINLILILLYTLFLIFANLSYQGDAVYTENVTISEFIGTSPLLGIVYLIIGVVYVYQVLLFDIYLFIESQYVLNMSRQGWLRTIPVLDFFVISGYFGVAMFNITSYDRETRGYHMLFAFLLFIGAFLRSVLLLAYRDRTRSQNKAIADAKRKGINVMRFFTQRFVSGKMVLLNYVFVVSFLVFFIVFAATGSGIVEWFVVYFILVENLFLAYETKNGILTIDMRKREPVRTPQRPV